MTEIRKKQKYVPRRMMELYSMQAKLLQAKLLQVRLVQAISNSPSSFFWAADSVIHACQR